MKKYFVSYPAVTLAIIIAFLIMLGYYAMQHKFDTMFKSDSIHHTILRMLPSILYSFVVIPLNLIYKYLSIALTDWGKDLYLISFYTCFLILIFLFNSRKSQDTIRL